MLKNIAAFEVRYQLRSPLFLVAFTLFFLLTFGAVTIDQVQIGGRGNVQVNSPYAILQTLAIMSVFAVFIVTAFVANVVIRDDETGFAPILRATRVNKYDYLMGRFVGAFGVAFSVLAAVPLAILIGSWMPWLDPEKIGPLVWSHYLYALFVYGLPTLLVMGAGFFALATATRSMMWTYVGVIAFLVLFSVSRLLLRDPAYDTFSALSDPFGIAALNQATKYWTAAERNSQLPATSGLLLYNRLIWLGIAGALFAVAYTLFRFEQKGVTFKGANQKDLQLESARERSFQGLMVTPQFTAASRWQAFWALTRFDLQFVFKSPAFFVLLALGAFNAVAGMFGSVTIQGVDYFPVTRVMVNVLNGAFSLIPIIIAIYYAGELVWRDRERRIHEIVNATAAPDWAFLLPKVMAITLVLLCCLVVAAFTAVFFQLSHGYTHLQISAYVWWFIVPGIVSAFLLAVLAIFVQTLVPQKFMGWAVMLLYVVVSVIFETIGFEHNLYTYAGGSPVPLSDMNDMGRFWIGRAWFQGYWLSFGAILLTLTYLLWRRGAETRLISRLVRLKQRICGTPLWVLVGALGTWVGTGVFIFYNTNVLNQYRTQPEQEEWLANYEKTLLPYETQAQPTITDVQLTVDLYPHQVLAVTQGSYVIENRSSVPLTSMHISWPKLLKMEQLEVPGGHLQQEYSDFNYRIYALDQPLQPQEKRTLRFKTLLEERGFPNSAPLTRIVENGTFLSNFEITPQFGVNQRGFLQDRAKRRKYGLPAELRPAKLEEEAASVHHYLRHDSDWVNAEITLTTDADQIPLAPGYTVSDSIHAGRRTLVTKTEAPIQHFFSLQSARYAVKQDTWVNKDGQPVQLAVYYHPPHHYNIDRMLSAMKDSLELFSQAFSPYQFRQARILEFPAYANFAQSFANTVPYSESIGFVQNYDETKADSSVDLVTYVTAHEIAHQWWAHQIIGADKQGMTLLSETFAQYSALLVMEKRYGKEQIRKFLKNELDRYLRSRGGELVEELPLNRVENQSYIHYQKGAVVMYWLKEVVGEAVVNRALQQLLAQYAFKAAPYPDSRDFIRLLRAEAGPQHDALITDLFEKITLYDMKATNASAKKLEDGRYEVRFTVEGKKLYADGKGKETEAPLDESFDIGVFTVEPGKKGYSKQSILWMERQVLHSGKQEIRLVVDQQPKFVGVDPYNKRIDRNSDDNVVAVAFR